MILLVRFLFVCGVLLAVIVCGLVGVTIWHFDRDLPDYQLLAHYQPPIMTRVHATDSRVLAEFAVERRVFVPIQAIPKRVVDAFLSAEDKNFYGHQEPWFLQHIIIIIFRIFGRSQSALSV